jgi:hypothetical protein
MEHTFLQLPHEWNGMQTESCSQWNTDMEK